MLRIDYVERKGHGIIANENIPHQTVIAKYPLIPAPDEGPYTYAISFQGRHITGLPWDGEVPHNVEEGEFVAHLINDGSRLEKRNIWPGLLVVCEDILVYIKSSRATENCDYLEEYGTMITTKTIYCDQEVLFGYGWQYWVAQQYGPSTSQLIKCGIYWAGFSSEWSGIQFFNNVLNGVLRCFEVIEVAFGGKIIELIQTPADLVVFKEQLKMMWRMVQECENKLDCK